MKILAGLFLLFLGGNHLLSAPVTLEGCGAFERDGHPGQTMGDFLDSTAHWAATSGTNLPDFDGDGRVTVLDLTRQTSCVELGPGLLARFYGYEDGLDQPNITLENTDVPDVDPVVVQAVPELNFWQNTFHNFEPLMNSRMHRWFRANFTGFLQVPESATYTFGLNYGSGMRLTLDGTTLIEYQEGNSGEAEVFLEQGFYPIKVDYINKSSRSPSISLSWRSNGTVIGPNNRSVAPQYLWHNQTTPEPFANTNLDVAFSVANYARVTQSRLDLSARLYAPETNFAFALANVARTVEDGVATMRLNLTPGINHFPWTASAGGRERGGRLTIYYDSGQAGTPGLAMMVYPSSVAHTYTLDEHHLPTAVHIINGADLATHPNGYPNLAGDTIGANTTVMMRGRLRIDQPGRYRFVGHGQWPSTCLINGRLVVSRYEGGHTDAIDLDEGYHSYVFVTHHTNPRAVPDAGVRWQPPGGSTSAIPPSQLSHLPEDIIPPADYSINQGHPARAGGDLIAEYLFEENAPFADSGRYNLDLPSDPRLIVRESGSVTANAACFVQSRTVGGHFLNAVKKSRAFTIEFDWYFRHTYNNIQNYYRINQNINITNDLVLRGYSRGSRFHFFLRSVGDINIPVDLIDGQRYHCTITYDGSTLRTYMNGRLQTETPTEAADLNPTMWSNQVLRLGDHRNDPFAGTVNAMAFYRRALSLTEINQNYDANRAMRRSTARLPFNETFEIIPPRTSEAQLAQAMHVLNRLSMGPTPEDVRAFLEIGPQAWINRQLEPQSIEESPVVHHLTDVYQPWAGSTQLKSWYMARLIHGNRQLEEVMTWFWENHFSTDLTKTGSAWEEYRENERFRALAMGNFTDLLLNSALNYPMTEYLDSVTNVVGNPNENYAREIFELHCYGEDNGYEYEDIVEAARIFTGWTETHRAFLFNPGNHDYGPKHLQGLTFDGGHGIDEGLRLIEHIAVSENTAEFISYKLCQLFIADEPPQDVCNAGRNAFMASNGDIKSVLRAILFHDRFLNDVNYRTNKVKTPVEFVVGMIRATGTQENMTKYQGTMDLLGMPLFHYLDPTGFPERAETWMNTNSVYYRWQLINSFSGNRNGLYAPSADVELMRSRYGLTTTQKALDFFEIMFARGEHNAAFRQKAEAWLTEDTFENIDLTDPANQRFLVNRMPQTLNYYMRLPQYNLQ